MHQRVLNVLLIDDDEEDYLIVRDLLAERPGAAISLDWAATYEAGRAAMAHRAHDAYLIDYHLGLHNGLELLHDAAADGNEAPLILLTGADDSTVDLAAMAAGATDYLVKGQISAPLLERTLRYAVERSHTLAALRASTARYRLVADTATDAIITIDSQGLITFANRAAETIFGYPPAELLGMPLTLLMPEQHHEGHDAGLRRPLDEGPLGFRPPAERTGRHRSGRPIPLEISIGVAVEEGRAVYTGVIRDVTARRQLEEQLRQALKMEAIGRLAGGVAHDFNNVLTAIAGYGELIAADLGAGDRPQLADVEQILSAARRAAQLTHQLLAFSRKQVLQPEVVSLNTIIAEIEPMLRRLIGEDILLSSRLDPRLGLIEVDPGQIQQVLLNLALNARDAMPTGGVLTISTACRCDRAAPGVALVVQDTGEGMDEETRSHLFEPFFTTKERGKGTGLGLSTVYGIVTQSGGEIAVESEPHLGTTFTILFPCSARGASPPASHPRAAAPPRPGSETVLLVEDDTAVRGLLESVLRKEGYEVLAADSGLSAVTVAHRHDGLISLLLTDVIMPGMSGADLMRQLRASRPRLQTLFISGYTDDALGPHGVLAPDVAFLQKPFHPEELARKVRAILDQVSV